MFDFSRISGGITFGSIITKSIIRTLIEQGDYLNFVRSGVNPELEHCADVIEEVCNASKRPKQFRIVLPSIQNPDLRVRSREAGRSPDEVVAKLDVWLETLAKLKKRLEPGHSFDVRTTMETHRYYAIFSESQMIFGPPFYSEASLTTSSFLVGPEETGVIAAFHRDFDKYFREKCKPYHLGDNDLLRKQTAARTIDEEVLLAFRGALPRVLQTLEYIVGAFPMSDGGGATKEHLHAKFGIDPADANRRLREMEIAGLLMRAGDRSAGDHCHGRLATAWGISVAKKYRNYQFDLGH